MEELGGGTGTSREALEDKTRRRRGGGGRRKGGRCGCVPPKPVSSLLLSRGLSREPCPKSLAPGGRLPIVKRWPLQAGPPAATAAASCPPLPHTHTHSHSHTSSQYPLHLRHHDNAPCGHGHRPVESIKKDLEETLEKGHSGATCFLAKH